MGEDAHLRNLVEAWGGDESALPEHEVEPFPDETRSPLLNDLIRLARYYITGRKGAPEFLWGMQKAMPALRLCLYDQKEMLPQLNLTPQQAALAKAADAALNCILEALAQMVASFTKEDLPRVEAGIELCKKSAVTLEEWHAELATLERREFGTVCDECGHFALPMQLECHACKNQLMPLDQPYPVELDWIVTPNPYSKIFEGLLATITQQAPPDRWLALVQHIRDGFATLKRSIVQVSLQDDLADLRPELAEQLFELLRAMDVSQLSLRVLQDFPVKSDLRAVDEAWFRLINEIPQLSRSAIDCRNALDELGEYLSSDEYLQQLEEVGES